jgi:NADH dehydrogenase FAD-containing subunit
MRRAFLATGGTAAIIAAFLHKSTRLEGKEDKERTPCRVLIVGGGTAGLTVASQLQKCWSTTGASASPAAMDISIVEPSNVHYYQSLWTMVAGGKGRETFPARNKKLTKLGSHFSTN